MAPWRQNPTLDPEDPAILVTLIVAHSLARLAILCFRTPEVSYGRNSSYRVTIQQPVIYKIFIIIYDSSNNHLERDNDKSALRR